MTRNVRTYDHFCLTARALERVGDRWSLLVIRDLLTGAKRFTDLMDRLGGITPKTLSQRLRELEDAGIVTADREPGRREVWYRLTPAGADLATRPGRAQPVGATACLAPAPGRRAAARRAPAPLRYPGHRPRRRRPRASPLALPPRRCGLPGRKRRPPVVAHRGGPARTSRRHDHRDHPGPDRPHLRRVRHRHRHHRRNRASPAIPATDQHHGHRRTARLNRSRGTGGHVRHTLRTASSVRRRPPGRTPFPVAPSRRSGRRPPRLNVTFRD